VTPAVFRLTPHHVLPPSRPQTHAKAWLRRGALRHASGRAAEGDADLRRAAALDAACGAAAAAAAVAAAAALPRRDDGGSGGAPHAMQAPPPLPPGAASLPHAAPGVVCEAVAGAGRGLRTETARAAGDVLLVEPPFAALVHKPARTLRCHACFCRLPPDALPCARCAAARYCGDACAAAAAAPAHAHAAECGGAAWPAALPADAVLAVRVAVRAAAAATALTPAQLAAAPTPEAAGGARAVAALLLHWEALPAEERLERALLAAVLARCLAAAPAGAHVHAGVTLAARGSAGGGSAPPRPSAPALLRALLALRSNSFAVTDDWAPACWAGGTRDQARRQHCASSAASLHRIFASSKSD
jgi:hypothetical protein